MRDDALKVLALLASGGAVLAFAGGVLLGISSGEKLATERALEKVECFSLASGFMSQGAWEPLHLADKHAPGRKQLERSLACFVLDVDGLPTREKPMLVKQWWKKL